MLVLMCCISQSLSPSSFGFILSPRNLRLIHFMLPLASLHRIHHHWYSCQNAYTCQHPRNDFDDLQFVAFCQSTSDMSYALVANYDSPHGMDQDSRHNPQDRRDDKEYRVEHRMEESDNQRISHCLFQSIQEPLLLCPIKSDVNGTQRNRPRR